MRLSRTSPLLQVISLLAVGGVGHLLWQNAATDSTLASSHRGSESVANSLRQENETSKPQDANLNGAWALTKYIARGVESPETVAEEYVTYRVDNVQLILKGGKPFTGRQVAYNTSVSPMQIEFINLTNGSKAKGIFRLEGEKLTIAILADPEKNQTDVPQDFEGRENCILAEYTRQ